jgi:hypothetical protein
MRWSEWLLRADLACPWHADTLLPLDGKSVSPEGVNYIEIVMIAAPRNHVIQQIDGHQCGVGDCDAVFGGGLMHFRTSGVSSHKLGGA